VSQGVFCYHWAALDELDVEYSMQSVVCLVYVSVMHLSPAKMAEQIEVLFGAETLDGARNTAFGRGPSTPLARGR